MKESKIVKVIKTVISDKWFEKKESWWISDIWYQSITAVWSGVNMAAMTAIKIGYGEGSDHQTMLSPTDSCSESALNGPINMIQRFMGCSIPFLNVKIIQPKFTAGVFSREKLWSRNKAWCWPFGDISNCNTSLRIHWFSITISHF